MMPARRPRGSDTAGRTSPARARSRGSFFARIFVFIAFVVGAASGQSAEQGYCTDPSAGCCECLCDGEPLTNPPVYLATDETGIDIDSEYRCSGSSGMGSGAANSCQDFYDFNGEQCVTGTESTRWVYPPPCTTSQYLDGEKFGSIVSTVAHAENVNHGRRLLQTHTWTQVGGDIDGEARGDNSGQSVSISSDGTRMAIGAPWNDGGGGSAGHVRIYEYDATKRRPVRQRSGPRWVATSTVRLLTTGPGSRYRCHRTAHAWRLVLSVTTASTVATLVTCACMNTTRRRPVRP